MMMFRQSTITGTNKMSKIFREGACPKCHEKIQVPDDREKIICMYCGQEICTDEALNEILKEKKEPDRAAYSENYNRAMAELTDVIQKCYKPMQNFKRDRYADVFDAFYTSHRSMFEAMEYIYRNDEQPESWLEKLSEHFVEAAKKDLKDYKLKSSQNQRLLDFNLLISVYLIPGVRKYPAAFSEPFADCLLKKWNQEFHTSVGKASFEDINNGFHRKLCYVTTAVCESIGKEPGCYELQVLKNYRDGYLETLPDGHALVEEYYDIAPTIVKRIEKQGDRDEIYRGLYQDYIMPCIQDIENQKYETCRERYQEMVKGLKAKYIILDTKAEE